jgi:rubredoxin
MKFPAGAFERNADEVRAVPMARFECGVCWWIYDPADGDKQAQVPAGTPFAALPPHWACPNCEAARERFLLLDDGGN